MNISSFVLEQALKQLNIPAQAIRQLQIAGELSNVDGKGFPAELFQLSAPMVTRGLLNYAILQMRSDWLYPHWVHQQLDPKSSSFVARSQNPLLLNITHRNWTLLGSTNGLHEAIVDPRGLVTPLPREWSIDVWLATDEGMILPSLLTPSSQEFDTHAPRIITRFEAYGHQLALEAFVDSTNHGMDVLFNRIKIVNKSQVPTKVYACVALRPFNPEGVAIIQQVEYKHSRQIYVDRCLGIVFAEEPDWVTCSNAEEGDTVNRICQIPKGKSWKELLLQDRKHSIICHSGLANAVAVFSLPLLSGESRSLHYSVALGEKKDMTKLRTKSTWRVSYEKRREHQKTRWTKELASGAAVSLADDRLQNIFDANVLTLLQLQDGAFISPGPFLYHHFWFRDAAPMVHALDRLGFHRRAQQVIEGFSDRQTNEGFFKGPDGEWDSNGEVLWLFEQHMHLTHSTLWLKNLWPSILQGAEWITQKRKLSIDSLTTDRGLMPPSLSAEHLGTVDQYYWDTFWSLAGIRSARAIAHQLRYQEQERKLEKEEKKFCFDVQQSLEKVFHRLGEKLIPASPSRAFNESAIGSIIGLYPLSLEDVNPNAFQNTLEEITRRFVDERGFYHPIVHSGYNPYLTMQIAHAYLLQGKQEQAWIVANTILRQCTSPYSLPEAIHPRTGGGAMGDGHHGWAAAEIVLFLLDCLVREQGDTLFIFKDVQPGMLHWGTESSIQGVATSFGMIGCSLGYETERKALCTFTIEPISEKNPVTVEITLPFVLKRVLPISSKVEINVKHEEKKTIVRFSSSYITLLLEQ